MSSEERYSDENRVSRIDDLLSMVAGGGTARLSWSPQDLADVLDHFLCTPMAGELAVQTTPNQTGIVTEPSDIDPALTFGDLLLSADPVAALLKRVKDYAKWALRNTDVLLPAEVAMVVYITTLCCAYAAGLRRFSKMGRTDVERSARWCLAQGWVSPNIRKVLRQGISALAPVPGRQRTEK
jgi:hypothetical protein